MKHITKIHINTQLYNKFDKFYFNAKLKKYKHSYGWDEVFRDIQLAHQDRILTPTNKTTDKWFGAEYNVARNKRGWAFAYIIKDDIMYIYDTENCRNLTLDYQNTEPFVMSNIDEPQQRQNFSMGYKISACRLDDGYIYLYKNGRQVPDYRFNEILNVFRKHKNGEIYAVGLYGGKKFKITLDGIAKSLQEAKLHKIIRDSVKKILNEMVINKKTSFIKKQLGEYNIIDGQWWDGIPHGLEGKGLVQDVRMYDKKTTNGDTFETIALFRRCDNRKYFYAQIMPIQGDKETIWNPLPLNKVPAIIRNDIRTINSQGHEPYLSL